MQTTPTLVPLVAGVGVVMAQPIDELAPARVTQLMTRSVTSDTPPATINAMKDLCTAAELFRAFATPNLTAKVPDPSA